MEDHTQTTHKYGNYDNGRIKFLDRFSTLCQAFAPQLSTALKLQRQQLVHSQGSNAPSAQPEDMDAARRKLVLDRTSCLKNNVCRKCKSPLMAPVSSWTKSPLASAVVVSNNNKFRLKPKAKTSKTIIRLLKQKSAKSHTDGSLFRQHTLSHYFNNCNRIVQKCPTCKNSSSVLLGEKRSDDSFSNRHSLRRKVKKLQKKAAKKSDTDANQSSPPVPGTSSTKQASFLSSTVARKTQSPMQSLKTDIKALKSFEKMKSPAVQPRISNKNSATVIRKFQQHHVNQMLKADQKKKDSSNVSSLQSFLKSVK